MMMSGSPMNAWNAAASLPIPPPPGLTSAFDPQAPFNDAEPSVCTLGLECRSDHQFILDLLAKLPSAPRQQEAAPYFASSNPTFAGATVHRHSIVHDKGAMMAMRPTETLSTVADDASSTKSGGSGKSYLSAHRPSLPRVDPCIEPQSQGMDTSKSITTLMVRNIPAMITQEMLYKQWTNTTGFTFNFLYLPKSSADIATNMGFAFVNFLSEEDATAFKEFWHKRRLIGSTARKPLNISAADVQGLRPNIIQLVKKRNPCLEVQECQPIIIRHGEFISLEQARKAIATSQVMKF